ncbi:MAG: ureidoglycolate lyase [Eubacteriales bacterium]|nr:ureidoglycolate lyase [Eubacteriales bacterium]MDD3881357.1 ureidoglycolate lyase [Eubacteriales bacterium]MDD4513044.1 ureidoglycolate lyase [Eubacteriales bacterium]
MRSVTVQPLTLDAFKPYGSFSDLLRLDGPHCGDEPTPFYRDQLELDLKGAGVASFSICRAAKRDFIIDTVEYHNHTSEGIIPLDGDILLHVAPATGTGIVPWDEMEVFYVPKGTMVSLRPGTWHHAPFTVTDKPVSTVIVLPERTYVNDCIVVSLPAEQQTKIEL